jgi:hypothetical protein
MPKVKEEVIEMQKAEHLKGLRNKTQHELLADSIARDTALLHKHVTNNEALGNEGHPEYHFANSKAGVIARRLCANLKEMPLAAFGKDAVPGLIQRYSAAARQYESNAQKSKPHGLAGMTYQEMTKVVEGNRKTFDNKVLRNRMLEKADDLKRRLQSAEKSNPQLAARLHSGITTELLNAASYTHVIGDGGTGRVPTVKELLRQVQFHGKKHNEYMKKILEKK